MRVEVGCKAAESCSEDAIRFFGQHLRDMVLQRANLGDLSKVFNRKPDALRIKMGRLGLKVVVNEKQQKSRTTTSALLPSDILSHEEALRVLAGAMKKAAEPGLDKLEIMRLKVLIEAAKSYDSVLKFERWVDIENRLLEMDKKIQELEKAQKV